MQALNTSSLVLTEKSGARRLNCACATETGFLTVKGVRPSTQIDRTAQRIN